MKNWKPAALAFFGLVLGANLLAQTLKIQPPTGSQPVVFCDYSPNIDTLWNSPLFWDALHQTPDLSEIKVNSYALAAKAIAQSCPGPVAWSFRILLDINSDSLPDLELSNFPGIPQPVQVTTVADTSFAVINFPAGQTLPHGHHKMEWMASNGCGQTDTLRVDFDIKDCKNPTVVCINGLEASIQDPPTWPLNSGSLLLSVSDFLQYAEDNCTPVGQLEIALRDADINPGTGFPLDSMGLPQTKLRWYCSQLGMNYVELWARDRSGNADFCLTYLILKESQVACHGDFGAMPVNGCIACPDGFVPNDVQLKIDSGNPAIPPLYSTVPGSGCFLAITWPNTPTATVSFSKNSNFLNGISTFDLVRLSKHLNQSQPFTNPYQFIAADINRDGQVTQADSVELKKAITGIYMDWPNNEVFRFIPASYQFTTANPAGEAFSESPFPISLFSDPLGTDFIAVQTGNLDGCVTEVSPSIEPTQPVENQFLVSPNPFSDQLEIRLFMPENGPARCSFFEPSGKKLAVETCQFSVGEQAWPVNLSSLPAVGVFTITLETAGGSWSKQVVRN